MGDGFKCNHPLTWRCCVDVICDLCVSFANKYLLHQLFFGGVVFVGVSCWLCFFLESQKVTVPCKDKWRMGDGLKCHHPLTWGCRVVVICDLCVSFASKYLLHQLFSGGVVLVRVSFWCYSWFVHVIC